MQFTEEHFKLARTRHMQGFINHCRAGLGWSDWYIVKKAAPWYVKFNDNFNRGVAAIRQMVQKSA